MEVGITTRSLRGLSNLEAAERMRSLGFTGTELCFSQTDSDCWAYNGVCDLSDITDARFREIYGAYESCGIRVCSVGVFTNLIEPDDEKLARNLAHFERHMELCALCGIPCAATECGFDPASRGVRADVYETRFARLRESLSHLCERAAAYNVCIALEPCVLDVVPSAKRMADLIAQVGSPRLKVLLDPANLIANSSEEDIFRYLAPHIAYFHGKDRHVNDTYGRLVGDGDIDWPLFLSLYHRHTEGVPFILEYANKDNCAETRERVLAFDRLASGYSK